MKLSELRTRRLLSVRKLATSAGVAPATIYHIEHGRTSPSFRAIRDISAALDVDPLDVDEFAAVIEGTGAGKAAA
ncbi:MAG: helix-turn-helix domain-containing protein [Chloroflexota bacterium]|nr:helix-turn-helix domain-containing protein [Chloroflexota bacterium]